MWLTLPSPLAAIKSILRIDRTGTVINEILHESVGTQERIRDAGLKV